MATEDNIIQLTTQELKTKKKFFFEDKDKKLKILLKEENKKADKIITHYPKNTYEGVPKYKKIKIIEFHGYRSALPKGISNWKKGYGFVKLLKPLVDFIEQKWTIEKIVLTRNGSTSLDLNNKTLTLKEKNYLQIHEYFTNQYKVHQGKKTLLSQSVLHRIFPSDVDPAEETYIPNTLSAELNKWKSSKDLYSESDKNALIESFLDISDSIDIISNKSVLRTKETIEEHYLEDVIALFEKYMSQETETETLEKKWQSFLSEHNWIFSHLFSFPVLLYQSEAYVGGKTIKNDNGKVGDFVLKNGLTSNLAFIEIKTHNTALLTKGKPYRGTDVFPISHDLSGGINQVLNQKDTFQKEFWHLKGKSKEVIESFNSKCIVILGKIGDLREEQIASFELFRSNSKDVEIVTFDELLLKLKNLLELMKGNVT